MIIKINFHKKGFGLGLVLRQRLAASRKWPISGKFISDKSVDRKFISHKFVINLFPAHFTVISALLEEKSLSLILKFQFKKV